MRTTVVLTAVAAALTVGGLAAAGPASAATSTQIVAFTVANGTLAISPGIPAVGVNAALDGGRTAATIDLGLTTVADTRISSTGWAVSAATTDFTLLAGAGAIDKGNAKFSVPTAPLGVLGQATFTTDAAPTAVDASGNVANLVVATATGVNTATFSPQLQVTVPNGSSAGLYTATITQTVV